MKKILEYTSSLVSIIDKNSVLEQLSASETNMQENLIPLMDQALDYFNNPANVMVKDNVELTKQFFKVYKGSQRQHKTMPVVGLLGALRQGVILAGKQAKKINELADESMPNKLAADGIDARNVLLLKMADYVSFVEENIIDILVYLSVMETREVKKDKNEGKLILPKFKVKNTKTAITPLARVLTFFSELSDTGLEKDFDAISKGMSILPDNVAGNAFAEKEIEKGTKHLKNMPFVSGFIGNPIYHIRMMIADWQVAKHNERIDYKRTIELKLLYLKTLKEGEENPNLEKQIEYYEKKASKLEYEINKMESE